MESFTKYSQSLSVKKQQSELPSLADRSTISLEQEHDMNSALKKRINELEGNTKILEKKYKHNLKNGFENKIKSFRLHAVLDRKIFK